MSGELRGVLHFRNGLAQRATLAPVHPDQETVSAQLESGDEAEIPFTELKAIFFTEPDPQNAGTPDGSSLAVEFVDGEVIRGTASYNPERNGFFLYPADRSRNDRIFVVNSAILSIEVEKL